MLIQRAAYKFRFLSFGVLVLLATSSTTRGDIFRWNGQFIPGTEGITPGPGVQLQNRQLESADLISLDLTGANFNSSNLSYAYFWYSTLSGADLTGAIVTGASFYNTTVNGFTKEQLYSTGSYRQRNLQRIQLRGNDLSGWDLSGQDLTNATFGDPFDGGGATLTGANLARANLTNAGLFTCVLDGADTRGAQSLDLTGATSRNAILPAGSIAGLGLAAGDQLMVRNYLGGPQESSVPIPINLQDHMMMTSGGVLQMLFDADPWNSTISFQPGIPVTLGGTLELTFADDVAVSTQVGRALHIFDWSGVAPTGEFAIESPYMWDLSRLYTSGQVTLLAIPEPATAVLIIFGTCAAMTLVRNRRCC